MKAPGFSIRDIARYAPYVEPYVRRGVKLATQWARGQSKAGKAKPVSSRTYGFNGVSTQHDTQLIYRRKGMPKRKRRQWKRFINKVKAVNLKATGTSSVVQNDQVNEYETYDPSANRYQTLAGACLYGRASNQPTGGWNDLDDMYAGDTRVLSGPGKILFTSAILDVTITNTAANSVNLEVDLYHVICKKAGLPKDMTSKPADYFANAATATGNVPGSATGLTIYQRGVSPFEIPVAISTGGWKIIKKIKHFVTNGQSFTYQIRDPRNWVFKVDDYAIGASARDHLSNYVPGKTQFIMVIAKPVAGQTSTNNTNLITMGITRKYSYKIIQDTRSYDAAQ